MTEMYKQSFYRLFRALFSSKLNTAITLVWGGFIAFVVAKLSAWLWFESLWLGHSDDCKNINGACWVFIRENIGNLMVGTYPRDQIWRAYTVFFLIYSHAIAILAPLGRLQYYACVSAYTLLPLALAVFLWGGFATMPQVSSLYWGGLLLNLSIFMMVIIYMMPVGLLLALGRRSRMPVIHWLCRLTVDFFRGVPMVTLLFFSSVILPFFFPQGWGGGKFSRLIVILSVFLGSYASEVFRGGIQALPKGQMEAAHALGLSYGQSMIYVILPQALVIGLPGFVNIAVGILKDTTLVLTIGMMDFMSIMLTVNSDTQWLPYFIEGAVFVAAVFWLHCYILSQVGLYWEEKIKVRR